MIQSPHDNVIYGYMQIKYPFQGHIGYLQAV